ncbi:aspartic peptidase domain-containing protein, partial [Pseudomassariella vexata]
MHLIVLIGTPVQHVTVQLDTGSDELWVNPNCTKAADPEFCHGAGFYDPGASNSSSVVPSFNGFTIFYEIGSAVGDYYEDNVLIGGANLTHTQFGVATNSSIVDTGILGLSYGSGENINYNNVLDQLYDQSYITRRQFSVAAGSVDNESGDLLFSGLDVKKFAGTLQEVPLIFPGPDGHKTYWVNQTYLGVSSQTSCQSQELSRQEFSAIIDTGASFTILPEDVMKAALAYFPAAVFNENVGAWTIDCQYRDRDATLDFGFGDAIINVPFHELIWEREPNQCLLGLAEAMPGVSAIIGDNFMRAAYVVFDQEKRSVFMANYKDCGSEILASTEDLMLK